MNRELCDHKVSFTNWNLQMKRKVQCCTEYIGVLCIFSALIWSLQLSIKKRIVQQNRLTIKDAFCCGGNRTKSRVPLNKTATSLHFSLFMNTTVFQCIWLNPEKRWLSLLLTYTWLYLQKYQWCLYQRSVQATVLSFCNV